MGSCKLLAPLSRISQPGCIMPQLARIIIFLHNVPRIIMPPATMLYRGGVEQNFTDFARFTHFLANLANFHASYKDLFSGVHMGAYKCCAKYTNQTHYTTIQICTLAIADAKWCASVDNHIMAVFTRVATSRTTFASQIHKIGHCWGWRENNFLL